MINFLTLSRILLMLPLAWVMLSHPERTWAAFLIFILGGMTDFLDGWLARRLNKTSAFGAMLDQICDKIFVIGALVLMVATDLLQNLMIAPVLLMIAREFFVAGLREYAAKNNRAIPVDRFGKIKTMLQFMGIFLLLMPEELQVGFLFELSQFCTALLGPEPLVCIAVGMVYWLYRLGELLLWLAAVLGWVSAIRYYSSFSAPK